MKSGDRRYDIDSSLLTMRVTVNSKPSVRLTPHRD